ncbi:MAG: bifunctional aspartate kinase/homoserine dehydrogenase I [Candidatus Harrisonbacteria bacterium]|nr:bifunctional aspartate kinase/homoserine dehydrogenase I [Candidatus Harrisonbacteria bacterium]
MKITKVLKFGGSSVGTPKMIKGVGEIVKAASKRDRVAVVVSAFQGVTDQLLKCVRLTAKNDKRLFDELKNLKERHLKAVKLLVRKPKYLRNNVLAHVESLFIELVAVLEKIAKEKGVSNKNLDWVASFGERLSAYIIAASTKNAYFVDARELVRTDNNFVNAAVDFNATNRKIIHFFTEKQRGKETKNKIPIITGFLGSTSKREITTLGRGGSDYSAAIFGAALGVKVVEIWTDVDGVMSADPRLVKRAVVLSQISYEEAIEMAYFGAKVIHPATMLPAIKKGIPILIKNTFNPITPGTWIQKKMVLEPFVKGITAIDDIVLVNIGGVSLGGIPGSAARVFEATARAKANVILISQASSEYTICFALKSAELSAALKVLREEFRKEIKSGQVSISTVPSQAIIALVGDGMRGVPGIAGKLFKAIGDNGVNISAIAQGGSERNISFVVDLADKAKALNVAHDEFFLGATKNIFLIGTGNIGGTLLDQIHNLSKSDFNRLRVCGIINAFNMLTSESGINLGGWQKKLEKGEKPDFEKWLNWAKELPLGNKVFVDCTASDGVARKYIEIAEVGFNIVTPNKKFNVRPMKEYKKLREVMAKNKNQFLYETNVGAALPIIAPLQDLLKTGDRITKIEGVFSGTLSYIFNNFDGTKPFSKVVEEAKKLGYTEPDPREDLSGQDVGRKLLVLAREIGYELEFKDIEIENLVPAALQRVKVPGEFLKRLKEFDGYFKKLLEKAYSQNKVLRYVARLERGRAVASLQAVPLDNPLASNRGADNIFAFWTKRYKERPLVVQGPGAGREVTAAGVLADILRI